MAAKAFTWALRAEYFRPASRLAAFRHLDPLRIDGERCIGAHREVIARFRRQLVEHRPERLDSARRRRNAPHPAVELEPQFPGIAACIAARTVQSGDAQHRSPLGCAIVTYMRHVA